jgi:membrane protease YdiL (CAAX protease family)
MYTAYTPPQAPAAVASPAAGMQAGVRVGRNPIPRTVVRAILLGVVLQVVVYGLTRGVHMQPAPAVAFGLGLTLAFYLFVFAMVQGRLRDSAVNPVWHVGPPAQAAALGVAVGAAQALFVVAVTSAVAGRLASDDVAATVFAQGGLLRIAAVVAVMVVCAPFIEELLFRGLLAESLRSRGRGAAIWLSAIAFAAWHLRPDALRYYLLCGALLGLLYWKRGLVCSMAAHATFSGTLVVVAAVSLSGPPHAVSANGVSLVAPKSWYQVVHTADSDLEVRSPSGAQVFVHRLPGRVPVDAGAVASRMASVPTLGPGVTVKAGSVHPVQYPVGAGAEAAIDDHGHNADTVVLSGAQGAVVVELITGGNTNAQAQFDNMLQSLTLT